MNFPKDSFCQKCRCGGVNPSYCDNRDCGCHILVMNCCSRCHFPLQNKELRHCADYLCTCHLSPAKEPTESVSGEHICEEDLYGSCYTCNRDMIGSEPQPEWESIYKDLPDHVRVELAEYAAQQFLDGIRTGRNDTLNEVEKIVDEAKTVHGSTEEVLSWLVGRLKANRDI